jgi:uncharacterized protein YbjT (DUF2867 family)
VDRNPYFPYYRVKLDAERVIERSPVPWTILRATQFHDLVLMDLMKRGWLRGGLLVLAVSAQRR